MCGRYTVLTEDEIIEIREILKELSLRIVKDDFEDYNAIPGEVFPSSHAPLITKSENGIAFENAKWGFKKWQGSGVIINARCETLKAKSTFSKHLETGRCVVPAGEFFEWEKVAKETDKSGKKKYYAKDKDGNLLFMAGLYRERKNEEEGEEFIREFVIITKAATGEMAKIHDRIPIILRVEQIEGWLTGKIGPDDIINMEYDVTVKPCEREGAELQISLFD